MTPCRVTHTSEFARPLLTGTYTNVRCATSKRRRAQRQHLIDDGNRIAGHRERRQIESDGPQRARIGVDEVTGLDVLRLGSGWKQRFRSAALQIERGDTADAGAVDDREQDGASARQQRGIEMVDLVLGRVGPGQHLGLAATRAHTQEPGRAIAGRKHDRIVRAPAGAARRPDQPRDGHRRAATQRNLP